MSDGVGVGSGRGNEHFAEAVYPEGIVERGDCPGVGEGVANAQDLGLGGSDFGKDAEDICTHELCGKDTSIIAQREFIREINVIAIGGAISRGGNGDGASSLWLRKAEGGRGQETKNPPGTESS